MPPAPVGRRVGEPGGPRAVEMLLAGEFVPRLVAVAADGPEDAGISNQFSPPMTFDCKKNGHNSQSIVKLSVASARKIRFSQPLKTLKTLTFGE